MQNTVIGNYVIYHMYLKIVSAPHAAVILTLNVVLNRTDKFRSMSEL